MKRRLLCAAFSITLALSVCCNAVYASEPDGMDASPVTVETEILALEDEQASEDMPDAEVTESEENQDEEQSGSEMDETESETEESSAKTDETEPDTEESSVKTDEPETEESSVKTDEPETEESSVKTDEPKSETEESPVETDETETEGSPAETEEDPAEADCAEELVESGEEIVDEEIAEVFYVSTGDGWNFAVNGNFATITGYTGKNTSLSIPSVVNNNGEIYVVNAIGPNVFSGNTTITAVTLPDTINSIGESAFYSCVNLREINLGTGLTEIGSYAFARSGLHLIAFSENVNTLGEGVLTSCESLGAIEINCEIQRIPADFASNCGRLTNVWLGSKVSYIDDRAFANTPMLKALAVNAISQVSATAFEKTGLSNGGTLYCSQNPEENWANASHVLYSLPAMNNPELKENASPSERKLRLETTTANAIIFYSTGNGDINGTSDWVTSGTELDFSDFKGTVYAKAYMCGQWSEQVQISLAERTIAAPTFTVKGVFGGRDVTFTSAQKGAVIYYSTKGSKDISLSSDRISNGKTKTYGLDGSFYGDVYAKAYYNGKWSGVSRLILKIPAVNDPIITVRGDKVTIRTTTPDAYIYYTTDGSTPSLTNGKRFSGSVGTFTMNSGTVRAIAVRSCFSNSKVVSKTIAPVINGNIKTPAFDVKGVIDGRTVTFKTEQPGATIYFSKTSSTITTSDQKVNNGETVLFRNFYGTIYARTYSNGQWSNVSRLILRIPVVEKPTVSYDGKKTDGHYYYTIRTGTPNALLYYTTDGSTPTPTNGKCIYASSGQIRLDGDYGVLKVIAVRSCFTNSDVLTYYY